MIAVISYPPIPIWDLGPLQMSLHGVFAALGFMVGAVLATREVRRLGLDAEAYQSALTWGLIGALLGARYLTTPAALMEGVALLDALNPIQGNFSIMGGFAGGIIAGLIRMRKLNLPVLPTLDASTFGLAIGTVVGRIGDLAIVEHLGQPTTVAWGYGIKPGYDVAPQHDILECSAGQALSNGLCPVPSVESIAGAVEAGAPGIYHHVAAYDLLGAAVLLGILYLVSRRFALPSGRLFFLWVAWYGLQRFVLDSLRFGLGDATVGPFTWNQVSGLVAGVAGIFLMWWVGRRSPATADA
ncbi:MAG TPA: prolipoprotein diacylglyceryl transferase family protein [Acidimicrobiia bacterium]|nr:prolipoprotein diacylglyceryl transferase family protein [Acidimicrobiia bacterium]